MVKTPPHSREMELYDIPASFRDGKIIETGKRIISEKVNKWIERRFEELLGGRQVPTRNIKPYIFIGKRILEDNYLGLRRPVFTENRDELNYNGHQGIAKNEDGIVYIPKESLIPKLLGENYNNLKEKAGMDDEKKFLRAYQKRALLHEYIEVAYREANNITSRDLSDDEHGEVESIVLSVLEYFSMMGNKTANDVYNVTLAEHEIRGYDDTLTNNTIRFNTSLKEYLNLSIG